MVIEPHEIIGKTIKDCYMEPKSEDQVLHIEFTDGTWLRITGSGSDDIFAIPILLLDNGV